VAQKIRIALDDVLREKHMTRYQLSKLTSINYQTIDNYYKNRVDRYDSYLLLKMCRALDCEVGELVRIINSDNKQSRDE
jgi:putative transcriptional regulator